MLPIVVWLEVFWSGLGTGWVCSDIRLLVSDDVFLTRAFFCFYLIFPLTWLKLQSPPECLPFKLPSSWNLTLGKYECPHTAHHRGVTSADWTQSLHLLPLGSQHMWSPEMMTLDHFRCFSPDFKNASLPPTIFGQPAALMFGIGI